MEIPFVCLAAHDSDFVDGRPVRSPGLLPELSNSYCHPGRAGGTPLVISGDSSCQTERTDALVVPVLLAGQSPYHMDFPGTITLSTDTMQRVYSETAQSLIQHGFRRILLHDSHAGNQYVTRYVIDRINQETKAVAVNLNDAVETMRSPAPSQAAPTAQAFDRHSGVNETSGALYLFPSLVDLDKATQPQLSLPPHLSRML